METTQKLKLSASKETSVRNIADSKKRKANKRTFEENESENNSENNYKNIIPKETATEESNDKIEDLSLNEDKNNSASSDDELIENIKKKINKKQVMQMIEKPEEKNFFFSTKKFSDFDLTEYTLKSLNVKNFFLATEIQEKVLPLAMEGKDIMATAKTGSGKSLSFLIPAVELLFRTNFSQSQGTGVIVLTPTRELAMQLYDVTKDLSQFNKKSHAVIYGGNYRKKEAQKLEKGVNLLIATPGRLLDHLKNTENFNYKNLCLLIIDEADAILKIGFEEELKEILRILPVERQTMLFSATLTPKVENLISLSMTDPVFVCLDKSNESATVKNLEQGYILAKPDKKFSILYTFIKKNLDKKIMIFFSSCSEVRFYSYLLNYIDIPVKEIHGDLRQSRRNTVFYEFFNMDKGILLCTDIAQRGLDFPDIDLVIQYDAPKDVSEYIHRVGRTARGAMGKGKALLILLENEKNLINHLENNKIYLDEYEADETKLIDIQDKFEKLIKINISLQNLAYDAYKSFIFSYMYVKLNDVYDLSQLDQQRLCKSFGLRQPPRMSIKPKSDY